MNQQTHATTLEIVRQLEVNFLKGHYSSSGLESIEKIIEPLLASHDARRDEELKKEIMECLETLKEDKPFVSPPFSEAYQYSLAQFNRIAGVNGTIEKLEKILSLIFPTNNK